MSTDLEKLGLAIKRVQDRHHRLLDARLAPLGISLVQWNALREIDRNPGASQHRLAELTFNSDQAFGMLSSRLLQRGLVRRVQGQGRAFEHQLTPMGQDLLQKGRQIHAGVISGCFAALAEGERATLLMLLDKLLAAPERMRED
jgi:DNA-binding MarR family transcriptional regulator